MQLKNKFLAVLFMMLTVGGYTQTDFVLYNMNWTPQSMYQNPALLPRTKVNIGLPVISSIYFNAGHNGFKWKDLVTLGADDSLTIDPDRMIGKLKQKNFLTTQFNTDLLSFGFRVNENYFSFNSTFKFDGRLTYPKDLMQLAWKGNGSFITSADDGTADFSGLGPDLKVYTEWGIGYARDIDLGSAGILTVGGKAKYLNGIGNIYTKKSDLTFHTDNQVFDLTANSDWLINMAGPFNIVRTDSTTSFEVTDSTPVQMLFGSNHGMGLDLGIGWKISDEVRITASMVNFGTIHWTENARQLRQENASFTFSGVDVKGLLFNETFDSAYVDSLTRLLLDSLTGTFAIDSSFNSYWAPTHPVFHLGGNFYIDEWTDGGLLLSGEVFKGTFRPGITVSLNRRVSRWLQTSISWSYWNRSARNLGVGFSANAGPIQLYIVTDNVFAPIFPASAKNAHLHAGINLTFGQPSKDKDEDGIMDKEDQCPETPGLAEYNGCPDADGDKIPDHKDNCPDIPGIAEFIGCPDTDGDGITDTLDACPIVAGSKELNGCPDRDGDKIIDNEDKCPDDPGPRATEGCPDKDLDGILDKDDFCPEKKGLPEHKGCPDTDADGVYDYEDKCVETPGPTDNFGCPYGDLDKDGVIDKQDRCVDTPGPKENNGCPYADLDADGVADNVDDCPNTPGPVSNKGCPVLEKADEDILKAAFDNLEFESGKAIIRASSYQSLDSLASLLKRKPDWKLNIAGHTDNVGNPTANMTLSKNRSNAVKDYLNSRGIAEDRFIVEWFGQTKPIYPNNTPDGRQKNRRVEMKIKFE